MLNKNVESILFFKLKRLGIDTYKEAVIYIREDCDVCQSEGFEVYTRIKVSHEKKSIIATLQTVKSELLNLGEAGLSEYAWELLGAREDDQVTLSHPAPLTSIRDIRGKIYGKPFKVDAINEIIRDVVAGRLSDIHISSFLTICAGGRLSEEEVTGLTAAMVDVGERISWSTDMVVDKHCIGGLPGNRTTPILVPIVAEFGLLIPKTSSRAITSAAGTADTMEMLAPVDLDFSQMRKVVEKEGGCIVWGGSMTLSPADDILIRVENALNIDSEGQLVASVLSKKIAAGSHIVVIDAPVGATAKVRTKEEAKKLKYLFEAVGKQMGIKVHVLITDGTKPVGRGIGPALEARDILSVLNNEKHAPQDLKERSLALAGSILECSPKVKHGTGLKIAREILESGRAWKKFQAICDAQGGLRMPPKANYKHPYLADRSGEIVSIDNRKIADVAKLAGAPSFPAAGVELHVNVGDAIEKNQPLFTIHAENSGHLDYALSYLKMGNHIFNIK